MTALNGRLLPRRIFGAPLAAVALAAIACLLLITLLLPVEGLHVLRPLIAVALVLILLKVRAIMQLGHRVVILSAINRAKSLRKARRVYE